MGVLVFDFGGSAIKYGQWDGHRLTDIDQFPTPTSWEGLKLELKAVQEQAGEKIYGIGIAAPGVVDVEEQCIRGNSAIPYIHGFNIFEELEELFRLPVTIENDANCAGMAEFYQGAAREHQNVAFVIIGSGIGGALFTRGQINKGAHLYGGEFGLMYLDQGKTFSELATAVRMAEYYCERMELPLSGKSGKEVFALAEQGDRIAQEEVEKFYDYLAQGLINIQFSFDPELIVLGGGVSAKKGLLDEIKERVVKKMTEKGLTDFAPAITLCQFRNDANLIGAAANFVARQQGEA